MASLRKRPGSNVWQCQYYVSDPKTGELRQVRKSTGQTSRKKALGVALELERNAQGVIEAGSEKAAQAKAVFSEAIAEIERETFTALSARRHLSRLLFIATGEALTSYTVESWGADPMAVPSQALAHEPKRRKWSLPSCSPRHANL